MDAMTFTADLVKSLAWPVATVAIAIVFRAELRTLLARVRKGKVGPAEFEFAERVAELRDEVAEIPKDRPAVGPSEELLSQAVSNPRGAIVTAWLQVEEAARALVLENELIPEKIARSPVSLIRAVQKADLLDVRYVGLFNSLRDLRNRATHDLDFSPDPASVINYVEVASELTQALRRAQKRPN